MTTILHRIISIHRIFSAPGLSKHTVIKPIKNVSRHRKMNCGRLRLNGYFLLQSTDQSLDSVDNIDSGAGDRVKAATLKIIDAGVALISGSGHR